MVINSDVQEINKATQEYVEAQFEVNFETMELGNILKRVFADWTILKERMYNAKNQASERYKAI